MVLKIKSCIKLIVTLPIIAEAEATHVPLSGWMCKQYVVYLGIYSLSTQKTILVVARKGMKF